MSIDDFIRCMGITPENAQERIEQARHSSFGGFGANFDYDCRPSGIVLNEMPSTKDEEIRLTWDDVLAYVTEPRQLTFF